MGCQLWTPHAGQPAVAADHVGVPAHRHHPHCGQQVELVSTLRMQSANRRAVRGSRVRGTPAVLALIFAGVRTARHAIVHDYQSNRAIQKKDDALAITQLKKYTELKPEDPAGFAKLGYG